VQHAQVGCGGVFQAVLGDVRDARVEKGTGPLAGAVPATHVYRPGGGLVDTDQRLGEVDLAVPADACDADDFARTDGEVHAREHLEPAVVLGLEARRFEDRVADPRGRPFDVEEDVAPDHEAREVVLCDRVCLDRVDAFAVSENRHPVGESGHLGQFVRDEDDRNAAVGESLERLEESLGVVGGEYRRGLVEYEQLDVAKERLQALHALAFPHREFADRRLRRDVEPVLLGQFADPSGRSLHVQRERVADAYRDRRESLHTGYRLQAFPDSRGDEPLVAGSRGKAVAQPLCPPGRTPRLSAVAQDDVLGHRESRDEHEMLVDHPDAAVDGVGRRTGVERFPLKGDRPGVAVVEAVADVHQRRLAGAVLAEQAVDLAAPDAQVDIVVAIRKVGGEDALVDIDRPVTTLVDIEVADGAVGIVA
jgi:hypothetical protein